MDGERILLRDQRKPGWLWLDNGVLDRLDDIGPSGLAAYVCLCRFAGGGATAEPSMRSLAEMARLHTETVIEAIGRLEAVGLVRVARRGRLGSTYYLLALSGKSGQACAENPDSAVRKIRTAKDPSDPDPEEDPLSQEDAREARAPARARKKPTQLPQPYALPPDWRVYADQKRVMNIGGEWGGFCDYWWSRGTARADWFATWRGWIRRIPEFQRRPHGRVESPAATPPPAGPFAEGFKGR
jgi:hypothetical protein